MEKPQGSSKECKNLFWLNYRTIDKPIKLLELSALCMVFLNNMIEHAKHLFLNYYCFECIRL